LNNLYNRLNEIDKKLNEKEKMEEA